MEKAQHHNLTSMLALILKALGDVELEEVFTEAKHKMAESDFTGAQLDLSGIDLRDCLINQ